MPRGSRRILLAVLLATCAGFAWWGFATSPVVTEVSPPHATQPRPETPGTPAAAHAEDPGTRTASADVAITRTPVGRPVEASTSPTRTGRVLLYPSYPMQPFGAGTALELALEHDDERIALTWTRDLEAPVPTAATAEVPPGIWRIVVVHGPGDRPGLTRSQAWMLEPPDDVAVVAGETIGRTALISRAVDAPDRGTCTIRGIATIDGRPAARRPVRLAPFGLGGATARTDADGRFELVDAPAGHGELQLLGVVRQTRTEHIPIHVLARLPIAGLDGEVLDVTLVGATAGLQLRLIESDGRPAAFVPVRLRSPEVLAEILPNQSIPDQPFRVASGSDGRVTLAALPAGKFDLSVGSESDRPLVEFDVELRGGTTRDLGDLRLPPRSQATIELALADGTSPRSLFRATAHLQPLDPDIRAPRDPRVERGDRVRFQDVSPGTYALTVRQRGRELTASAPLTLVPGENPSIRAVLRPSPDVAPAGRPTADRPIESGSRDRR